MAEILRWEPMTLLGKPVPDVQVAVLDDPRGVQVRLTQNDWGAFRATIEVLDPETETYVVISWPLAEPDHRIPEDSVKAWAEAWAPKLAELFGPGE